MKDYYKILGVEEEASEEEIRARWVELTKHYHPDLRKTEEGNEKIREINEAYEVLKDEPSRFQYDFERDLKRSFVKKAAHHRQERETSIRKIIMIPSGMLVLFLIVGFILLRSGRIAPPPEPTAETVALHETDKGSGKWTASRPPPAEIDSKAQRSERSLTKIEEVVTPPERKKEEVVPPESTKMASLRPPPSPSQMGSEQKKEPARGIPPEPKVAARVDKEPPASGESESKRELTPQVVMKPEMPATKEVPGEAPKETPKPVAKEIPKEVPKEAPKQAVRETRKDVPREAAEAAAKEAPKEVAKEVPREIPKEVMKEVPREVPKEAPKEIPKPIVKEIPKEVPEEVPKQVTSDASKEVHREVPKEGPRRVPVEVPKEVTKEVPREVPKEAPKEIPRQIVKDPKEILKETPRQVAKEVPQKVSTVTFHPGEQLTMWTKGGKVISSGTSPLAKEEEVKQFFSTYVDRYNRRDVGGFLSLFSSRAIQNQTDRSEAIRNFYATFFNQSQDLRYRLEGMKVDISPYRVVVKARFRVDQKLKEDGEEKVWKGKVRWALVKEEGRLKISSLDYQNEKSP
jgi:curved DNA-binding protein CbpA